MAIIRCPECGKDVSDTSPSCIHCGFQLAKHFSKLQAQNELQKELDEKLRSIENMDTPEKPNPFEEEGLWWFIVFLFMGGGTFICWLHIDLVLSDMSGMPGAFVLGLLFIALALLLIRGIFNRHKRNVANYKQKVESWDEYKEAEKERIISEYKIYSENIMRYGNRDGKPEGESQQKEHIVKCPACGSTEVKKISTAKKVVSTEFWGLASSDIGKQMVCEKCGYKF